MSDSSLQLCCYYDYYDASAINGKEGIGRGVCGVARSRDILVYNGGYGAFVPPAAPAAAHAKEISFTFYDELVIMPYATLEKCVLASRMPGFGAESRKNV